MGAQYMLRLGVNPDLSGCDIHIWDNKSGYNNHVLCYDVLNILLTSIFEHEHHDDKIHVIDETMCDIFNVKGPAKSNLSGRATLAVDQDCLSRLL